jgi:predicted NBD/HSP70 family sugar kinase
MDSISRIAVFLNAVETEGRSLQIIGIVMPGPVAAWAGVVFSQRGIKQSADKKLRNMYII